MTRNIAQDLLLLASPKQTLKERKFVQLFSEMRFFFILSYAADWGNSSFLEYFYNAENSYYLAEEKAGRQKSNRNKITKSSHKTTVEGMNGKQSCY